MYFVNLYQAGSRLQNSNVGKKKLDFISKTPDQKKEIDFR